MGQQVCAPWAVSSDLCFQGGGTTDDDCVDGTVPLVYKWDPDQMIMAVSNILYARTGFRFPGVCSFDVWPCIENCWSEQHRCVSCCAYNVIALPTDMPVVSIDAITEDGVTLDPANYRLERRGRIVRTDGERWALNSFGIDCAHSQAKETIVTYSAGEAPPIELRMATAALVDELMKSCNGQSCELPSTVTSFARRGVHVDLTDLAELLKTGATGIPIVDHALKVHEPISRAPRMSDPASRYRRQGGMPVVP